MFNVVEEVVFQDLLTKYKLAGLKAVATNKWDRTTTMFFHDSINRKVGKWLNSSILFRSFNILESLCFVVGSYLVKVEKCLIWDHFWNRLHFL